MAYDIIRRKNTKTNLSRGLQSMVSGMGADAMDVAQALRNPAITDAQAATALKKGTRRGEIKVGIASFVGGLLLGRYVLPGRKIF